MKNPWNLADDQLTKKSAVNTVKEICQQPQAWLDTLDILAAKKVEIEKFVEPLLAKENLQIIFTGAGTSDYVGDTIAPYLKEKLGKRIEAIATTDIVANPLQYLEKKTPTVLVSFARSGNSPESVAAYDLAEQLIDEVYQVVITCNAQGTLAKRARESVKGNTLLILNPPQTNDLGFAMTSSFTSMVIGGLMIFDMKNFEQNVNLVKRLASCSQKILQQDHGLVALANSDIERFVFIGSGSLHGLAQETCLKLLELTSGKVVAVSESVLGFRHGPKSIINDKTAVIMLMSSNKYTRKYDIDLLNELKNDDGKFKVWAITSAPDEAAAKLVDKLLIVDEEAKECWGNDAYNALCYVIFDHILAVAASLAQNITPDNPRPDGTVNRVVKGVTIHNFDR